MVLPTLGAEAAADPLLPGEGPSPPHGGAGSPLKAPEAAPGVPATDDDGGGGTGGAAGGPSGMGCGGGGVGEAGGEASLVPEDAPQSPPRAPSEAPPPSTPPSRAGALGQLAALGEQAQLASPLKLLRDFSKRKFSPVVERVSKIMTVGSPSVGVNAVAAPPPAAPTMNWAALAGFNPPPLPLWLLYILAAAVVEYAIPAKVRAMLAASRRRGSAGAAVDELRKAEFPVGELSLGMQGNRSDAKVTGKLWILIQAARQPARLTAGTGRDAWLVSDVVVTEQTLFDYLHVCQRKQSRYGRGAHKAPPWRYDWEDVLELLLDPAAYAALHLVLADLRSGELAEVTLDDALAPPSSPLVRRGPPPQQPPSGRRLLHVELQQMQRVTIERLETQLQEQTALAVAWQLRAEQALGGDVLQARQLNALVVALHDSISAACANQPAQLFPTEALLEMTSEQRQTAARAERLGHLTPDLLDATLDTLPALKARLLAAVAPLGQHARRPVDLAIKARRCFALLLMMARARASKAVHGVSTAELPLLFSHLLLAVNAPPIVLDFLSDLLRITVTNRSAHRVLRDISELMPASYPFWFAGKRVVFWTDNFQLDRSWVRQLLRRKQTIDTNPLLQAGIWMVFEEREWWLLCRLHEFGLKRVPIDEQRPEHFGFWPRGDPREDVAPFWTNMCAELSPAWGHGEGGVARSSLLSDLSFIVRKKAHKHCWRCQPGRFPAAAFAAPLYTDSRRDVEHGGRLLPERFWRKQEVRLGRISLLPTNKPEEVGRFHAQLLRWFRVGVDPARQDCIFVGDYVLHRNHGTAASMTVAGVAERVGTTDDQVRVLLGLSPTGSARDGARLATAAAAPPPGAAAAATPSSSSGATPAPPPAQPLTAAVHATLASAVTSGAPGAAPAPAAPARVLSAREKAGIKFGVAAVRQTGAGLEAFLAQRPKPIKDALLSLAVDAWGFQIGSNHAHLRSVPGLNFPSISPTVVKDMHVAGLLALLRHHVSGAATPGAAVSAPGAAGAAGASAAPAAAPPPPPAPGAAETPANSAFRAAIDTLRAQQPVRLAAAAGASAFDPLVDLQPLLATTLEGELSDLWSEYVEQLPGAKELPRSDRDLWCAGWFDRAQSRLEALELRLERERDGGLAARLRAALDEDLATAASHAPPEHLAATGEAEAAAAAVGVRSEMLAQLAAVDQAMRSADDDAEMLASYAAALSAARLAEANRPRPADQPAARPGADLAFPDLLLGHAACGWWHFLVQGGMAALFKMKYDYIFRYAAHDVLKRKGVSRDIKSVFISIEVFYHVREALVKLMLFAYEAAATSGVAYLASVDLTASATEYDRGFQLWLSEGMASGDEVFAFYADVVFGSGLIWHAMYRGLKTMDVVRVWASLPLIFALFDVTGKTNLKRQAMLTMMQLLSADPAVAERMLANTCVLMSDRFGHAKPVDDAGETLQARDLKLKTGKKWDEADAMMFSGAAWFLNRLRSRWERLGQAPPGPSVARSNWADAGSDIETLEVALAGYDLFAFRTDKSRRVHELPPPLIKSGTPPVPPRWRRPFDLTKPLSSAEQPALIAAYASVKAFLAVASAGGGSAAPAAAAPSTSPSPAPPTPSSSPPAPLDLGDLDGITLCTACSAVIGEGSPECVCMQCSHEVCASCFDARTSGDETVGICVQCAVMLEEEDEAAERELAAAGESSAAAGASGLPPSHVSSGVPTSAISEAIEPGVEDD